MKMSFQWFFDFSTVKDSMQIITVSAGGELVRRRLQPFFSAYKYFKLGSVKMTMVPASTLPVDPTGLSYEAGENTVDPRDQLNMGLTRITNGEDIFEDLTGVTPDVQRNIYYTMLMDRRWYKWQLQRGLKRSAIPLYWQIGQLHQDYFPGATINLPGSATIFDGDIDTVSSAHGGIAANFEGEGNLRMLMYKTYSDPRGLFQVGHRGKMGWMPTDALYDYAGEPNPLENAIPEVEVFKVILPPAYKTKYYYRCYVTETCYFKDPVVLNAGSWTGTDLVPGDNESFRPLDRFVYDRGVIPELPTYSPVVGVNKPSPPNDGAGDY